MYKGICTKFTQKKIIMTSLRSNIEYKKCVESAEEISKKPLCRRQNLAQEKNDLRRIEFV
jgi:hypothetical protein